MPKSILLLAATLTLILAAPLAAQEPCQGDPENCGPAEVLIKLKGPAKEPRTLVVGPRGVGVCRKADSCGDSITWRWVGGIGNWTEGESIEIRFTSPDAATCFQPTTLYLLRPGESATATLNHETCPETKTAWFYDVSCRGGANGDCGGVPPIDPGAMVDGSR